MKAFILVSFAAVAVSAAAQAPATQAPATAPAALKPTGGRGLTEVHGIKVGQITLSERPTGCTVILVDGEGVPGGVSQRGGAPGTRETDLLDPLNMVDRVNAVVLSGGSAYGLEAATGTMRWLEEHKMGWPVGAAGVVPIVPSAILMDLGFGGMPKVRPTADCGYKAAAAATTAPTSSSKPSTAPMASACGNTGSRRWARYPACTTSTTSRRRARSPTAR